MGDLLTTAEVSTLTRIPVATLRFWRSRKAGGPPSFSLGRKVFYKRSDVDSWVQQQYEAAQTAAS